MDEKITTTISLAGAAAVLGWVIYGALPKPLPVTPYAIVSGFSFILLGASAAYVHKLRDKIDLMHGMMAGMAFGMAAGIIAGTLYVIPSGDFLTGLIVGSAAGLLFGVPFGVIGGPLGIMEGVMAGPMGGMMGAMLGQMVRPYNLALFVPFFMALILITLIGITYAANRCASCCDGTEEQTKKGVSSGFGISWASASAIVMLMSLLLPFSAGQPTPATGDTTAQKSNNLKLPPYLQELAREEVQQASIVGGYQEIRVNITASKYHPNVILAKKGVPLKITFSAGMSAGCAREVVFPELKADTIVQPGSSETVLIDTSREGTFTFRCPMDMVRGKLVIS